MGGSNVPVITVDMKDNHWFDTCPETTACIPHIPAMFDTCTSSSYWALKSEVSYKQPKSKDWHWEAGSYSFTRFSYAPWDHRNWWMAQGTMKLSRTSFRLLSLCVMLQHNFY